jgi:hypothetical protein
MSTPQTKTIEVDSNAAVLLQFLEEKAAAQGLSLEELLRPLAESLPDSPAETSSSPEHNERDLALLHPNQHWLQTNRDAYRGQWVVLYQGELVAHGIDGEVALETARSQGIPEPFIAFIPAEDHPFAGF